MNDGDQVFFAQDRGARQDRRGHFDGVRRQLPDQAFGREGRVSEAVRQLGAGVVSGFIGERAQNIIELALRLGLNSRRGVKEQICHLAQQIAAAIR